MAPCEGSGDMKQNDGSPASSPGDGWNYYGSSFLNRLNTLPVVQSTIQTTYGIYTSSKEKHALIGKGLGYIEYGVTLASNPVLKAANTIAEKYPVASTTANKLDNLACSALETLETRVPVIQKEPGAIVSTVKKGTSSALHSGVRRVMTSFPGKHAVRGLDAMIEWSEATLAKYEEQRQKEAVEEGTESDKEGKTTAPPTLTLKNGVVVPVKLYLQVLKMVKHMSANMAGVKTRTSSTAGSPRKPVDVSRRKKVTPKKRLQQRNLVLRLTGSAMSMLGLRKEDPTRESLCRQMEGLDIGDMTERNEKRKLDDLDAEDACYESECESLNLASALDNYNSGEDSDYVPEDEDSDDSLEYNSGDTESDLETEDVGKSKTGKPLKQLSDKRQTQKSVPATEPKPESKPPVPAPPPQESPKVSLQPEWKKTAPEDEQNKS